MILIDYREKEAKELQRIFLSIGVASEIATLEFGDFALEGNGPHGKTLVGIERKKLHNVLSVIDSGQYSGHQGPGMYQMYGHRFFLVEGDWAPGRLPNMLGMLLERFPNMTGFAPCRYRAGKVMYSKLYRYLLSISMSGVTVLHSRNLYETAVNITEVYHWFQKSWSNHTSLITMQNLAIPSLGGKPSLVRRWAAELEGIDVKLSQEADKIFKTPIALAQSDHFDWVKIKGLGVARAKHIIGEIWGRKP
jgi:ERCC4-type nuclease